MIGAEQIKINFEDFTGVLEANFEGERLEKLKTLDIANANTKDKSSLVEPPKRDRNNLKTNKNKNRSQVVIIEKGVPTGSSSAPSGGGGGGGSSLNSLSGLQDSDAMKNGIKKLQSIIFAN